MDMSQQEVDDGNDSAAAEQVGVRVRGGLRVRVS